jgi:hypothetical protein
MSNAALNLDAIAHAFSAKGTPNRFVVLALVAEVRRLCGQIVQAERARDALSDDLTTVLAENAHFRFALAEAHAVIWSEHAARDANANRVPGSCRCEHCAAHEAEFRAQTDTPASGALT